MADGVRAARAILLGVQGTVATVRASGAREGAASDDVRRGGRAARARTAKIGER